jgi:stage III sporulation protein AH
VFQGGLEVKKIFRKNQLVITALALMIAVAGYFSYMNNNLEEEVATASTDVDMLESEYDISDEDFYIADEIFTDEGTGEELALVDGTETAENEEPENPGEAVLTSTTITNLDYAAEMKLNREQIRSKNKESLLEIVNNTAITDSVKQEAINKMIAMTDIAEREAAAEMLLEAKGFTDVVVSITDDSCDVVLNMGEMTDAKRAQVEDIVKRKTNISADKIVITPIVVGALD